MSIISLKQHVDLRRSADPQLTPAQAREQKIAYAAEQFEALFLQQILRQMRKANDALGASSMSSRESGLMRDLYDEVLAETLATQRQTGLSDMLVKQLSQSESSLTFEEAERHAREGTLPRLSLAQSESLRSTWQRPEPVFTPLSEVPFKRLVQAVIAQESGGNAQAVSPKGAQGLMQLMPDTAKEMAAELGLDFDPERLLSDAEYNKTLGSAYLEKMLSRYDGHQGLALAAYNAGPARVDEWLERFGDPRGAQVSTQKWLSAIPYAETRDYARRILTATGAIAASSFKRPADVVALSEVTGTTASAAAHQSRSAAFAQPIRLEPRP